MLLSHTRTRLSFSRSSYTRYTNPLCIEPRDFSPNLQDASSKLKDSSSRRLEYYQPETASGLSHNNRRNMPSLLKRWLHKFQRLTSPDLHPRDREDAEERLEPTVIPTTYACEELTSHFVKHWAKIKEDDGHGLEEIQINALARWHNLEFEWRKSVEEYPLPLDAFVGLFDDYFFLGALRPYTDVELVDDTQENFDWAGISATRERKKPSEPPHEEIRLKPSSSQLWNRAGTQRFLETLLHEMTHAFLEIYSSPVEILGCNRKIAETTGLTGHGPCWVKVAAAIAAEADRSLGGLWDKWDLGVEGARSTEKKALMRLPGYRGLHMMGE